MNAYLLRGVRPYGEEPTDLLIGNGLIRAVGSAAAAEAPTPPRQIDAEGLVALPGLVDLHTHLREPGREDAETVASGTRAAATGGFTCVHAMANTTPTADTAGVVEQIWRLGADAGWADVRPIGAVTMGRQGRQLAELGAMAQSAAGVRVFSDDGDCVSDPMLMRRALEYVKSFDGVVAQHAQEPRLTQAAMMHEGVVSAELGMSGWPAVAEEAIIARDVLLAEHVASRVHICHVSTAGSVEILRWAKARGIRVTAEATPHHLMLTDAELRGYDPLFKVNPPLRTAEDVEAVRTALADGTIDIVATDHAPHPREDKDCEFAAAAMGMTGLETALSVVTAAMVRGEHEFTWRDLARTMSQRPAEIGQVAGQGHELRPGAPGHLVLLDPDASWTVQPEQSRSTSHNTPFAGRQLPAPVHATFYRGVPTVLGGELHHDREDAPA